MRSVVRTAVFWVAAVTLTACSDSSPVAVTATSTTATSGSGATAVPTSSSPTPSDSATSRSGGGRCPGYPTPSCTGVPAGTKLTDLPLNTGDAYRVTKDGTVLDGVRVAGNLLITAHNVTIRDSEIDGFVTDEYANVDYSYTITDSTVGPASGCDSLPGVGEGTFTARGVLIRNHGDGFRDSGDNIEIYDSYVHLCSNPGDHSDGIQSYMGGNNLVLDHNTLDQRDAHDITAPIFLTDQKANVSVTNNLVLGGTYSIQVRNASGTVVVRDNRMVNNTWVYEPVEADCAHVNWSGNTLVTIDADYGVTSTVGPLPCVN